MLVSLLRVEHDWLWLLCCLAYPLTQSPTWSTTPSSCIYRGLRTTFNKKSCHTWRSGSTLRLFHSMVSLPISGSGFDASVADFSQRMHGRKCFSSFIKKYPIMLIGRLLWWQGRKFESIDCIERFDGIAFACTLGLLLFNDGSIAPCKLRLATCNVLVHK